jgi:hypothetical protein
MNRRSPSTTLWSGVKYLATLRTVVACLAFGVSPWSSASGTQTQVPYSGVLSASIRAAARGTLPRRGGRQEGEAWKTVMRANTAGRGDADSFQDLFSGLRQAGGVRAAPGVPVRLLFSLRACQVIGINGTWAW